jgi:hypothetical protein
VSPSEIVEGELLVGRQWLAVASVVVVVVNGIAKLVGAKDKIVL